MGMDFWHGTVTQDGERDYENMPTERAQRDSALGTSTARSKPSIWTYVIWKLDLSTLLSFIGRREEGGGNGIRLYLHHCHSWQRFSFRARSFNLGIPLLLASKQASFHA